MIALISLDATSLPLLDRLVEAGRMPHLAAIRDRGRSVRFESTPFFASVYPSLMTGVGVSDHGMYYPFQWSAHQQRVRIAEDLAPDTSIFHRLAKAGKRICVVDPTDCAPRQFAGGIAMAGWQFRSRLLLPKWSVPKKAYATLSVQHGKAEQWNEVFGEHSDAHLKSLHRILLKTPGRLAAAAESLIAGERPDLLWVTFVGAHLAGHKFWDAAELDQPGQLSEVYETVDAALGRIIAALPAGADIVVFSPKSMGPDNSRVDLLPEMLGRVLGNSAGEPGEDSQQGALWRIRAALPSGVREKIAALMPDRQALELTAFLDTFRVDWATTRAFSMPSDCAGFVRLNLKGREREGIVDPADAGRVLDEIAAGLLTFNDIGGGPAIAAVTRSAELAGAGGRLDWLPDLVVEWAGAPVQGLTGVSSSTFGEVKRAGIGTGRYGNHIGETWAIVVPGAAHNYAAPEPVLRAVDLGATVCQLLNADGEGLAGRSVLRRN